MDQTLVWCLQRAQVVLPLKPWITVPRPQATSQKLIQIMNLKQCQLFHVLNILIQYPRRSGTISKNLPPHLPVLFKLSWSFTNFSHMKHKVWYLWRAYSWLWDVCPVAPWPGWWLGLHCPEHRVTTQTESKENKKQFTWISLYSIKHTLHAFF